MKHTTISTALVRSIKHDFNNKIQILICDTTIIYSQHIPIPSVPINELLNTIDADIITDLLSKLK